MPNPTSLTVEQQMAGWLRAEQVDESSSPQHGEHFESWQSGYLAAIDAAAQKLAALTSTPAPSGEREALTQAIARVNKWIDDDPDHDILPFDGEDSCATIGDLRLIVRAALQGQAS